MRSMHRQRASAPTCWRAAAYLGQSNQGVSERFSTEQPPNPMIRACGLLPSMESLSNSQEKLAHRCWKRRAWEAVQSEVARCSAEYAARLRMSFRSGEAQHSAPASVTKCRLFDQRRMRLFDQRTGNFCGFSPNDAQGDRPNSATEQLFSMHLMAKDGSC